MPRLLDQFVIGPITGELEFERYAVRIDAPVEQVYQVIGGYEFLKKALNVSGSNGAGSDIARGDRISGSRMGYKFGFPAHDRMEKGDEITLQPLFDGLVIGFEVTKAEEDRRVRLKYTDGPLKGKVTWTLEPDKSNDNATILEFTCDCSIEDPLFRAVWLLFFQWIHYFVIGFMLLQIRQAAERLHERSGGPAPA